VNISLDAADAMEFAQFLQFLDDWLAAGGPASKSLACFTGSDAYDIDALRGDLARFIFALGGSDGEGLFSPRASPG
jgi:hypothetical protein